MRCPCIGIMAILLLLLPACQLSAEDAPVARTADDSEATPEGIAEVVRANNQFAFDLYAALKDQPGNVFFSPYSISTAFAMAYEGARGSTADEIQSVFHFPEDAAARRSAFAALHNTLNAPTAEYTVYTANGLWADNTRSLLPEYVNAVERYYASDATNVDFEGQREQTRKLINDWVSTNTAKEIQELFPPGSLSPSTRLVLANAVYFKGDWQKPFNKRKTKQEEFRITPDKPVMVPMMQLAGETFNYAEAEGMKVLELQYAGGELSMLIFLPQEQELHSFEKSITVDDLTRWKDRLQAEKVDVYISRFTFDTKYSLRDAFSKLGMPSSFGSAADFSGMGGTNDLFVDAVLHSAVVKIDERGTEAAAATAVGDTTTSMSLQFRADHPFIFIIQDKRSGAILFLGRLSDPRA